MSGSAGFALEVDKESFELVERDHVALVCYGVIALAGAAVNFVAYDRLNKERPRRRGCHCC